VAGDRVEVTLMRCAAEVRGGGRWTNASASWRPTRPRRWSGELWWVLRKATVWLNGCGNKWAGGLRGGGNGG
jgi:hypothetical protein